MSLFSRKTLLRLGTVLTMALLAVPVQSAPFPIESVLDDLVASLCEGRSYDELASLDNAAILSTLTAEQREILSTAYWGFDVDIPVTVSVMRDIQQKIVPFWLTESGFEKTGGIVKNEVYTYEVWQKKMPAGHIGLGINGFDRHRPHYFVGVGSQQAKGNLTISNVTPVLHKQQKIHPFALGSSMYLDWSELVVTEMPESLEGHRLLTTIRGRAREAHLLNAFRKTAYPSSETPDMTVLTWSDNPQSTQTIQWRTSSSCKSPYQIYYRKKDDHSAPAWDAAEAAGVTLTDRNIINNTNVLWYTSTLTDLSAGTCYEYIIAPTKETPDTVTGEFRTAPADNTPFTFLWMSDTHKKTASIPLLQKVLELHPETAFLTISGDLVDTGQHRDDWDQLFSNYRDFLKNKPLVPSIGNHDAIDGLGSDLYRSLMLLPDNGPAGFKRGQSYSLRYSNLLLVSLDVTDDVAVQSTWLENILRTTDAQWKVAVFHFPPYAQENEYPDIEAEWCTLFDRYHVDLALSGHVHDYIRSWPLHNGIRMKTAPEGTIYCISVAVPSHARLGIKPDSAEVMDLSGIPTCPAFIVDGNQLTMHAYAADGSIRDSFTINK